MAYTQPTLLSYNRMGTSALINTVSATGGQTPFQIPPDSGRFWGQVTFQAVLAATTVFATGLEIDMTGVDANFTPLYPGLNLFASPGFVFNLNGGNVRYRFNVTTLTDGPATIWAICG